jgi:hypothetical protein
MEEQKSGKIEEVAQLTAESLIDQAKKLRDEIRAENERREVLLKQEQEFHAVQMLSGTASAGNEPAPKTPEELKKAGALEFWKGSEIENAIRKYA